MNRPTGTEAGPRSLLDKVWASHRVRQLSSGQDQLFIDTHLIHEVTSPQAFDGLRLAGRQVRRPDLTAAKPGPLDQLRTGTSLPYNLRLSPLNTGSVGRSRTCASRSPTAAISAASTACPRRWNSCPSVIC